MTVLHDGVLKTAYDKVRAHLLKVDCQKHAATYFGKYGEMNAEPEFSGKYIDICTQLYRLTGDEAYLQHARVVVDAILARQEKSGSGDLGMLPDGFRWKNFSVWNQTFTVLGLLSYYRTTKEARALHAAERCAAEIAHHFLDNPSEDILDAFNDGTQHISFLLVLPELYRCTKNPLFYDFLCHITDRMRHSDLNFFRFRNIFALRSRKAIENFVILIGMLSYEELTGDQEALTGAEQYWEEVSQTQIRNTGNGTLHELFTPGGNQPMLLDESVRPNENCVAAGWLEFSLKLFYKKHCACYLDAVEQTLYNHLLGSLADDGGDFAYYQPNYGRKIFATSPTSYQCCRYRGFTVFAYLPDMLYYADDACVIPLIYHASEYEDETLRIIEETDYPRGTTLRFHVTHKRETEKALLLRIPA